MGGTEYEYDIDARTGSVVKYSREGGWSGSGTSGGSTAPASGTDIGADKAAQTALRTRASPPPR